MIKVNRKELTSALSFLGKAVSARTTLPVLQAIKATARDGKIEFQSSNLTMFLSKTLEVVGDDSWTTCVPYDRLKDIVGVDTGEDVALSLEKDKLKVSSGKSRVYISCFAPEDFPLVGVKNLKKVADIDAYALKGCLGRITWAANSNEAMVTVNSVFFNANTSLKMACLDGFGKLSAIETGKTVHEPFSAIIPLRSIAPMSELDGIVDILIGQNQIAFQSQDTLIISQLVDGKFADYEGYIKKEHTTFITVYPSEIVQALKIASAFARDDSNITEIYTSRGEQKLVVGSRVTGTGIGTTDIDAEIEGEDLQLFFDIQYLKSALEAAGARCKICMDGTARQAIIYTEPQDGWVGVVSPMNVKERK